MFHGVDKDVSLEVESSPGSWLYLATKGSLFAASPSSDRLKQPFVYYATPMDGDYFLLLDLTAVTSLEGFTPCVQRYEHRRLLAPSNTNFAGFGSLYLHMLRHPFRAL
jgi:hypothetical protein